ncbi:MAG: ABC transporter ATP-binding protein [Lachnospiraceae bacterium]|nr:ABC transporter ATP-binding protein [Lachnospiraceae bacterium]
MIEISDLTKSFGSVKALNHISLSIKDNEIFGLIGTNGAGKSTLLRLILGILKADTGSILLDEKPVGDDPLQKEQFFFVPDDPYFLPNATLLSMCGYYRQLYRNFDTERFEHLAEAFSLDLHRPIRGFSRGMKRQTALILGLSAGTRYLICDETFDGLDPVVRQAVKSLFASDMTERDFTPIIASHNLRELEDICDHVGLLHRGGILLSENINDMKLESLKLQCVFEKERDADAAFSSLKIVKQETRGRLHTLVVRGTEDEIRHAFAPYPTIFLEMLPLTLEEIFISETEVAGYDVRSLIFE